MNNDLTPKEIENLKLFYLPEKEAGKHLFVSTSTVHRHRYNIFLKLGTKTTAESVIKALKLGIISLLDFENE